MSALTRALSHEGRGDGLPLTPPEGGGILYYHLRYGYWF